MYFHFLCWCLLCCIATVFGQAPQSIGICTSKIVYGVWDPDKTKTGLTGSEEAVVYVSEKLAQLGYEVHVFADVPPDSPYAEANKNPRYIPIDNLQLTPHDILISWRMPTIGPMLRPFAKKLFFWPHDLCSQKLSQQEIDAFDDVLWLSHSQRAQWCAVNPGFAKFTTIIGNGINPEQFHAIEEKQNPYSCIYASSYDRGLQVLLNIWPAVKKQFPKATLDIYYGWQSWGHLSPPDEARVRAQLKSLHFLGVTEHGLVGHNELHRAYEKASLWTYPCILLPVETFCISALKAQYAGAVPVIIDGSALKETVRCGTRCTKPEEYLSLLLDTMRTIETVSVAERTKQREFIQQEYTWEVIAKKWQQLFIHK